MHFPVEPIFTLDETVGPQLLPPDLVVGGLSGPEAHTLVAMGAIPADAIYALLNIPNVPLGEWHRMREEQRQSAGSGRRQRPRTSRSTPDTPLPA